MIKTLALVTGLFLTQAQDQATLCEVSRDTVIIPLAESRDTGLTVEEGFMLLITLGLPEQVAYQYAITIWRNLADKNPAEVGEDFMTYCIGQGV